MPVRPPFDVGDLTAIATKGNADFIPPWKTFCAGSMPRIEKAFEAFSRAIATPPDPLPAESLGTTHLPPPQAMAPRHCCAAFLTYGPSAAAAFWAKLMSMTSSSLTEPSICLESTKKRHAPCKLCRLICPSGSTACEVIAR